MAEHLMHTPGIEWPFPGQEIMSEHPDVGADD